ncbi:MAG: transglycosylase SLT domain-containing protein [Salinibacter sp.]
MQYRSLLLVAALGTVGLAVLWRSSVRAPTSSAPLDSVVNTVALSAGTAASAPPDTTRSSPETLRKLEVLYRLQADLMQARSEGDAARVESVLRAAIGKLETLAGQPKVARHPRFRRAFRTLTNAYEARYGVPDTLRLPRAGVRTAVHGLSASLDEEGPSPSIVDALPTELRKQGPPVPLTLNRPVKESIAFLLNHKQRYLYPWLRRASTYFPMIEQILAEEGVPDVLKYLAIAESGLNPHAQSRAQAAGIWQFVAETGRRYGLSIDPWVDERLDPEKSTRAAARHLKDLHDRFGDWQLALAGYNCDPGVVQHYVRQYRQRTGRTPSFWDIYDKLPEETRNYVPLFTATALIVSNPAAFDLKRVQAGPRYAFDYVPVEAALTIETVARLARTTPNKVRALNPELRSDRLPPSEAPYYVRLPHGTYSTFARNYAALSKEERTRSITHTLQPGETAGAVAERYHVERAALLRANDTDYPITMRVGERLTVPETTYAGNVRIADSAGGTPLRVRYGRRTIRPIGDPSSGEQLTATLTGGPPPSP